MSGKVDFRSRTGIYFLGIGGIGMSALARYFNSLNIPVAGYDRTETQLTRALVEEGMDVHYDDAVEQIPAMFKTDSSREQVLVIYTPAMPGDSAELGHFKDGGYQVLKRAEVLGIIAGEGACIGVAGTHGKTTVTSMIAHIMNASEVSSNTFLGGISANYGTNHIQYGDGQLVIAEADEYDRSFLFLHPNTAVLTSVDADHLDIYKDVSSMTETYIDFTNNVVDGGVLLLSEGVFDSIGKRVNADAELLT